MKLPESVREQFRRHGRTGGRARAARLGRSDRQRIARQAVTARWIRSRFGAARFEALSLPGGDLVDRGLADLAARQTTADSLLVSLAAPRLRREGVPLVTEEVDAHARLYELLVDSEGELAHVRFKARLRRIASFADACHALRAGARGA